MASVKVKFRPSTIEGKTGALYFQVIHRRIVRSQKTKYKIYPDEWNARTAPHHTFSFQTGQTFHLIPLPA